MGWVVFRALALLVVGIGWVLAAWGQAPTNAWPTWAEWQKACSVLPSNRAFLSGLRPSREHLALPTFRGLDEVLDAYFALETNGTVARTNLWVGSSPGAAFLDVSRGWFTEPTVPFEPFAQKLVLPASSPVLLQGDLHGDIHSLLAVVSRWQERGWLEGFQVKSPDVHVIFLGDYTDRGRYGIEVIYTLLRLKIASPERVHLVRGNHEDLNLVARYGFLAEGEFKYGREFNAAKVIRAYDFLPVVLYVGCGTNFVQLCHGGMEPGYSPTALLNSPGKGRYQLLGPLNQATFLRKHPTWLQQEPEARAEARQQFTDFTPQAPTSPSVLGFMWNDFTVFQDEPGFAHNPERAFVYGQPAVAYLLQRDSTPTARLRAVIRGHQHSSLPNPLMRRLVASRGLFRHWQETNTSSARLAEPAELATRLETVVSRPLPEGSVWTLNVSPDSVYGVGCRFDFATFGVLRLAPTFSEWRLDLETVTVSAKR